MNLTFKSCPWFVFETFGIIRGLFLMTNGFLLRVNDFWHKNVY